MREVVCVRWGDLRPALHIQVLWEVVLPEAFTAVTSAEMRQHTDLTQPDPSGFGTRNKMSLSRPPSGASWNVFVWQG